MNRTIRFLPLVLALTLAAAPASAAMKWGAEVFGAWNTHTMDGWNDAIDEANESGLDYESIENGFSFGAGPTLMVNDTWQFGAHFEMLMPKKSSDETTDIEIDTAANVFGASVGYWFPSASPMRFGLNGSIDYYTLASELSDPSETLDVEGSGVGFMIQGMGSYRFSPLFSGNLGLGYRIADIEIDEIGGEPVDGSLPFDSQDYSGLSVRAGLSMNFGQ